MNLLKNPQAKGLFLQLSKICLEVIHVKSARHALILRLIESEDIETQDDLVEQLKGHGCDVTQATISRDIKELRLIKVLSSKGCYKYATVDQAENRMAERFIRIFSQSVLSMTNAGNLIIIKVLAGSANVAAEAIDSLHWSEIAGTLAGDNTIFCALSDQSDTHEVLRRFQTLAKSKD